jgi:hypothetical protein
LCRRKPELVHIRGSLLFIDPTEVSYHSRPTLRYIILIEILEVEEWHALPDSSSDDGHDDGGGDGDDSHQRCFIRPWPKQVRFDGHSKEGDDKQDAEDVDGGGASISATPPAAGQVLIGDLALTLLQEVVTGTVPVVGRIPEPPVQTCLKGKESLSQDWAAVCQEPLPRRHAAPQSPIPCMPTPCTSKQPYT